MKLMAIILLVLAPGLVAQDEGENPKAEVELQLADLVRTQAQKASLQINSISHRKPVEERDGFSELRTYFGYDGEFSSLLSFLEALDQGDFNFGVEVLNISARQKMADNRSLPGLSGNMVLLTPARNGQPLENGDPQIKSYDTEMIRELVGEVQQLIDPDDRFISFILKRRNNVSLFVYSARAKQLTQELKSSGLLSDVTLMSQTDTQEDEGPRLIFKATLQFGE